MLFIFFFLVSGAGGEEGGICAGEGLLILKFPPRQPQAVLTIGDTILVITGSFAAGNSLQNSFMCVQCLVLFFPDVTNTVVAKIVTAEIYLF